MLLSVIIPVYNSENFIDSCIEILSSQSFGDFEAIFVVDKRSSDNSLKKLICLSDLPFKVRILEQDDDMKASGARNIGLKNASGDYTWFMDVDDHPSNSFIKEMMDSISEFDSDIAICNFCYSRSDECCIIPDKKYTRKQYNGMDAVLAVNEGKLSANVWDKVFRTSLIKDSDIRFRKGYSEDYNFVMHSFLNTDRIVYYNKPLYTYYLHDNSRSKGLGDTIAKRDIEIFEDVARTLKEEDSPYYEEFCAITLKHILHSLTNTSGKAFSELSKAEIINESLKYEQKGFSMEIFIFKINISCSC